MNTVTLTSHLSVWNLFLLIVFFEKLFYLSYSHFRKKNSWKRECAPLIIFPAVQLIEMIEAVFNASKTQSSPVWSHEELLEKYEYWPLKYAERGPPIPLID